MDRTVCPPALLHVVLKTHSERLRSLRDSPSMGNAPTMLSVSSFRFGYVFFLSTPDVFPEKKSIENNSFKSSPTILVDSRIVSYTCGIHLQVQPETMQVLESGLPRFCALFCRYFSSTRPQSQILMQSVETDWVSQPPRHPWVSIGLAMVS